jgi:NADH:ubiquinone oxidoreductase subunit E
MTDYRMHILICGGTGCKASESNEIKEKLNYYISEFDLEDEIQVVLTGCFGFAKKDQL